MSFRPKASEDQTSRKGGLVRASSFLFEISIVLESWCSIRARPWCHHRLLLVCPFFLLYIIAVFSSSLSSVLFFLVDRALFACCRSLACDHRSPSHLRYLLCRSFPRGVYPPLSSPSSLLAILACYLCSFVFLYQLYTSIALLSSRVLSRAPPKPQSCASSLSCSSPLL